MDRKKMIYIGSLLILTAIISIASFSYAIWSNKSEQRGKLNIVAGSLRYELISDDLTNNSITIPANTNKIIEIEIKSLNNIESKYELYYESDNENVKVGYLEDTINQPVGTISSGSSRKVKVLIKNRTLAPATIMFNCQGGFNDKELVLSQSDTVNQQIGSCVYEPGEVWLFPYNGTNGSDGTEQVFDVPCDGYYRLEAWGAQGGTEQWGLYSSYNYGGYSIGNTYIDDTESLYINVGGAGRGYTGSTFNSPWAGGGGTNSIVIPGGYNGGGDAYSGQNEPFINSGGGATHIATVSGLLKDLEEHKDDGSILIVAAGGGAYGGWKTRMNNNGFRSSAGGYTSNTGNFSNGGGGSGTIRPATQTTGFAFGLGQQSWASGGGGYYGGYGSHQMSSGGSSYIGNSKLTNKSMYCYACSESTTPEIFTVSTTGSSSLRDTTNCPSGYNGNPVAKCAKSSHGYAKITYLGEGTSATIYSAANDEIYFKDKNNNKVTIGTTDSTGKLENAFVPDGEIIYSSVAKDPNNLSNPYSEVANKENGEIYLMPDGNILYWYGYQNNIEICSNANGWTNVSSSPTVFSTVTTNANRIDLLAQTNLVSAISNINPVSGTKVHAIGYNNVSDVLTGIKISNTKYVDWNYTQSFTTSNKYVTIEEDFTNSYIIPYSGNNKYLYLYALWYE